MRAVFGVLSLLVVLAVVGFLVKKQLAATTQALPGVSVPASGATGAAPATVKNQARQTQEQFKQAIDAAVQQPRPMPDDK
jgi:hypothetical protein